MGFDRKMKKSFNILLALVLVAGVFFLQLDGKGEKKEKKEKEKPGKTTFLKAGHLFQGLNNPYRYGVIGNKNPVELFQLSRDFKSNGSGIQFYVRDLKFNLMLISDTFQFQSITLPKLKKRWGRVLVEGLGHLIYATASYWIRQDVMKEDWEYHLNWADQKRRFLFLDGTRFDSNTFQFNWSHSMAGAMYYNYARVNRLNVLESTLFSFGASYFWEFIVEFKEVVSINDVIGTPMGGPSIGEALYHVSRVIRDQPPTVLNRVAGFFTNPIMSLNYWLDRKKSIPKLHIGARDLWHDFRVSVGPRTNRFSGEGTGIMMNLGFESQVMIMPEYGKTGFFSGYKGGTLFTEFNADTTSDQEGLYEFNIYAKTVLFGYFRQAIRGTNSHDRTGYSFFVGAGTVFDLERKRTPAPELDPDGAYKTDKLCVIGLLGPAFDLSLFHKDLKVRLTADAYVNFSLVHSLAYYPYTDLHEVTNTKSTLKNHGYYYALGLTTSSVLQINIANLELRGRVKYHYFDSVEGMDRFQKDLADEDDFDLKDKRFNYRFSLGYMIPNSAVQLALTFEKTNREGWLKKDFHRQHSETRSYFQVKYLF
jgi:hypothetical protein